MAELKSEDVRKRVKPVARRRSNNHGSSKDSTTSLDWSPNWRRRRNFCPSPWNSDRRLKLSKLDWLNFNYLVYDAEGDQLDFKITEQTNENNTDIKIDTENKYLEYRNRQLPLDGLVYNLTIKNLDDIEGKKIWDFENQKWIEISCL